MNSQKPDRVAIFSNTFWSIYNFRRSLIKSFLKEGYEVIAISADDSYRTLLEGLGCETIVLKSLDAKSTSLLKEVRLISEIRKVIRQLPCEYIYTFTIKPNIYTAIVSLFGSKKTIVTVNGLGNVFSNGNIVRHISLQLFRIAFGRAYRIFFQNKDDYFFFRQQLNLRQNKVVFVRGSGVNVDEFSFSQKPPTPGPEMTFLLACRLLKEKGIYEYIEAARRVKLRYPAAQFWLIGMPAKNQSAINIRDLHPFEENGTIRLVPPTDNINALLEEVDVMVLPSYYNEGIPRTLLEALSKGLPIVTTNSVGCKETVIDRKNGYMIEPKSIDALQQALIKMIELPQAQRQQMRTESRLLAETEFDETKVVAAYLGVLQAGKWQVALESA